MWNKIINWFFPDWKVVDVLRGVWLVDESGIPAYYTVYEILYSKRENKYKLKGMGEDWKKHPVYKEAIQHLNQLENEHRSNSKEIR